MCSWWPVCRSVCIPPNLDRNHFYLKVYFLMWKKPTSDLPVVKINTLGLVVGWKLLPSEQWRDVRSRAWGLQMWGLRKIHTWLFIQLISDSCFLSLKGSNNHLSRGAVIRIKSRTEHKLYALPPPWMSTISFHLTKVQFWPFPFLEWGVVWNLQDFSPPGFSACQINYRDSLAQSWR